MPLGRKKKTKNGSSEQLSEPREVSAIDAAKETMRDAYVADIQSIEELTSFHHFGHSALHPGDFTSQPKVLLMGQYSTGKTSFVRHVVGRDYPGLRLGPEPTTDRFHVVTHGIIDRNIPGNAAAATEDSPWHGLNSLGSEFLKHFEVAEMSGPVTQGVTLIDTPGILSGEKQRVDRGYDFGTAIRWFAERADVVLLFFDAHKLDVSDEFKRAIDEIKFHHSKCFVVLNKADTVSKKELIRIHGALMWSLGKIFNTPEACKVYLGSFRDDWDRDHEFQSLFREQHEDLMEVLRRLPLDSALNRADRLIERLKRLRVHIYILAEIKNRMKSRMPSLLGKGRKMRKVLNSLESLYVTIQRKNPDLPPGDFPDPKTYRKYLGTFDLRKLKKVPAKRLKALERINSVLLPSLVDVLTNKQDVQDIDADVGKKLSSQKMTSPFTSNNLIVVQSALEDLNLPSASEWDVSEESITQAKEAFEAKQHAETDSVGSDDAKQMLLDAGIEVEDANWRRIWHMVTITGTGRVDQELMAVAVELETRRGKGDALPNRLPLRMVPPSKRTSPIYSTNE